MTSLATHTHCFAIRAFTELSLSNAPTCHTAPFLSNAPICHNIYKLWCNGYINGNTHTRAIQNVISCELLTKQAMRKFFLLHTRNIYTLQLLLNLVTAGTGALVVSWNKLLYACVKDVCCLWAQPCFDTFHQLIITVAALWSKPVLQVGKQVVVAWREIRAVRRVVKELQAEMLLQCWSTSSCKSMWTHAVMKGHYTRCQHSMPFVLNGPMRSF
jgi:hypothetical protein